MKRIIHAAAALALLSLAACGGGEGDPNQPSAQERQQLDDIARKQDEAQKDQTFDTSADSLVINEGAAETAANDAAPSDPGLANTAGDNSVQP